MTGPQLPWSFTVEELVAAGIDEIGAFQPLLRPRRKDETWPQRRRAIIADLVSRGLLIPEGDGWAPLEELRTVLVTRALSTSVAVTTLQSDDGERRSYLLGRFAGAEGLLRLVEVGDAVTADLTDRATVSRSLVDAISLGARLTMDVQVLDDPDVPMRRQRLIVGAPDEQGRNAVVVGVRHGEDTDSWEGRLDASATVALCARALAGDDISVG
jgi:hypothetical protein